MSSASLNSGYLFDRGEDRLLQFLVEETRYVAGDRDR